jgi:hypothetical protein
LATQLTANFIDFVRQSTERRIVRRWQRTNDDIHLGMKRNQPYTCQLAKTSSQTISFHHSMTMLSNNYSEPDMRKQGGDGPNFQMFGTQSSPCSFHKVQI